MNEVAVDLDALEYREFSSAAEPSPLSVAGLWNRLKSLLGRRGETRALAAPRRLEPAPPPEQSPYDPELKASEYRALLPKARTIAVFHQGTCVFSESRLSREATVGIIRKHGPVEVGTRSADFRIARLQVPIRGWLVRYHHRNMLHFESAETLSASAPPHAIGVVVRTGRAVDARYPRIIHFWQAPAEPDPQEGRDEVERGP